MSVLRHRARIRINVDIQKPQLPIRLQKVLQHRLHAGEQLCNLKRLCNIVLCAEPQPFTFCPVSPIAMGK